MRFNLHALADDLSTLVGRRVTLDEARDVRRDLQRHQTLAEAACNGDLTPRQVAAEAGVERRLRAFFGPRLRKFQGDPRGATVKLHAIPLFFGLAYFQTDLGGNLIFTGYRR